MKVLISEQQLRHIITEQSSTIIVSSGFTASGCDELHAFQETKEDINGKRVTKTIGNMNVIVGDKLRELYNKGMNPTVKKVTVTVKGMRVDWVCEIGESTDGKAWVGFTSRGSGCGNESVGKAESSLAKKDIGSIKKNIENAYTETNVDIEKIGLKIHDHASNGFVQIFYRYTKPNSFPPIAGSKSALVKTVNKVNSAPVSVNKTISVISADLSTFLTDIKTETLNKKLDLNSVNIDVDNLSLTVKSSDKGVLVKKLVLTLSTQTDGNTAADNVLGKNPGSKIISNGKFESGTRTYPLIAII